MEKCFFCRGKNIIITIPLITDDNNDDEDNWVNDDDNNADDENGDLSNGQENDKSSSRKPGNISPEFLFKKFFSVEKSFFPWRCFKFFGHQSFFSKSF